MVTGSVASSIHGTPRLTNDLDIVIAPNRQQLRDLAYFVKRFGYVAEQEVAEHALQIRARPEDVLIAKLEWAKISPSERQMQDAAGILTAQGTQLDMQYIEKWIAELDLREQWQTARELAR